MSNLTYKGLVGEAAFDEESGFFHGEVVGVRDVITFQALSAAGLQKAFEESIEDYLEMCRASGDEPPLSVSGP